MFEKIVSISIKKGSSQGSPFSSFRYPIPLVETILTYIFKF